MSTALPPTPGAPRAPGAPLGTSPSLAAPPDPATRPSRARQAAGFLGAMLLGALAGAAGIAVTERFAPALFRGDGAPVWFKVLLLPAAVLVVVLVHELGHLAAGALGGGRGARCCSWSAR